MQIRGNFFVYYFFLQGGESLQAKAVLRLKPGKTH
jgi:hypothetical protein